MPLDDKLVRAAAQLRSSDFNRDHDLDVYVEIHEGRCAVRLACGHWVFGLHPRSSVWDFPEEGHYCEACAEHQEFHPGVLKRLQEEWDRPPAYIPTAREVVEADEAALRALIDAAVVVAIDSWDRDSHVQQIEALRKAVLGIAARGLLPFELPAVTLAWLPEVCLCGAGIGPDGTCEVEGCSVQGA